MNILIAVAHPDDETLMCGGAIARHVAEGDRVKVLTFTDGVRSRLPDGHEYHEEGHKLERQRWLEHGEAMTILGVAEWYVCPGVGRTGWPDQRLDMVGMLGLSQAIRGEIDEVKPEIIYTHWIGDLNQDHRRVAEAVLIATRPAFGSSVRRVLAGEVPETTSQSFGALPPFAPNWYVDISKPIMAGGIDPFGEKLHALACYESEKRQSLHPRSEAGVTAQAVMRGAEVGIPAAEAFVLLREVRQ